MSSTKTLVFVTDHEAFCVRNVPVAVFLMFVKIAPRAHDGAKNYPVQCEHSLS